MNVRTMRVASTWVLLLVLALVAGSSSDALACPVCFGAEETPLIDGAKMGILALLVVTLAVQGGFVAFFLYLRTRAKRISNLDFDEEWSKLQGGTPRI